jgi:hypothetical protein
MRLGYWIALACTLGWCGVVKASDTPSCRHLNPPADQKVWIGDAGGRYCLDQDIHINDPKISIFMLDQYDRTRPDWALEIRHSDVELDLQGHSVYSGKSTDGVVIDGNYRAPNANTNDTTSATLPQQVTLRNGSIHSTAKSAVVSGYGGKIVLSDFDDPLANHSLHGLKPEDIEYIRQAGERSNKDLLSTILARLPKSPTEYPVRSIHLENLHIVSHFSAINVAGAGTVIRHCVIETDEGTGIWIYGPNAIIEDNTIIVHGNERLREADAPIRLIQGDGAVIRRNRIVLKNDKQHYGIAVFNTGRFISEGNTFYGVNKDEMAKAFTGELSLDPNENSFEAAWKGMFVSH